MSVRSETDPSEELGARPGVFSRLMVGYDGSDAANAAAGFALGLAAGTGAPVSIVHVCAAPEAAGSADVLMDAVEQVAEYEHEWQGRLENLRDYAADDLAIDCRVVRGQPAGALIDEAAAQGADLMMTGSHGVGKMRGALLGSVSSQLLMQAPCSVMVFREAAAPTPAAQVRTVVAGIDGSDSSDHARAVAQELARALGARLLLVHAYDPEVPLVTHPTELLREQYASHGRDLLRAAREALTAPLEDVEGEVREGRAQDELAAVCEANAPAVLVVGSRGRGGFRGLLLGSTSMALANTAPCPVLVARSPAPES